jgi:Xaa-Pro dipeptidase
VEFKIRGALGSKGTDRSRLAKAMERADLDVAVVSSPENVFYLTGYPTLPSSGNPIIYSLRNVFPYGAVVQRDGSRNLICWGFSVQEVDMDVEGVVTFFDRTSAFDALTDIVGRALGVAHKSGDRIRIGIESTSPYNMATHLRAHFPDADLVPVADEMILSERRIKTEAEVEALRRSVEVAEGSLTRVIDGLAVGSSRLAAIRLAKQAVLELGGDGVGHVTMSFNQANPEIAIDEILRENTLAVIDVGAKQDGYTSDCRRYAFAGPIPRVVTERHKVMCDIVASVGAHLAPGVSYAELTRIASDGFVAAGRPLPLRFTHIGHGIGLETEEEWITNDPDKRIEEGMVVAIELYTDADSFGNIGDEETYVVRKNGPERLSLLDTAIRSV